MIRFLFMALTLTSCNLQETVAPLGPMPKQCVGVETALEATRKALDEQRLEWLGQVIREVFVSGQLSPEFRAELDDPSALEMHLEGNHLRTLVGVVIEGFAELIPSQTFKGIRSVLSADASIASFMTFMDEVPSRWDVLDPVREIFSSCRDGEDLADLMTHLPLVPGSCGDAELLCAIDDLVIVLKSPDLSTALSGVDFEGRVGRDAFQQLIIHIMDVTSTPGFDSAVLTGQLRSLFGDRLDDTTLDALEDLVGAFGRLMAVQEVQQPWSRVVSCVKRYDPQRAVSGLTYDLLTEGGFNAGTTAQVLASTTDVVDSEEMMNEWSQMAKRLADDSALRERLSYGLRPFLVPTLMRWLSPRGVALQELGVLAEWLQLMEEGLPCED